jgi:hypothetical protein
MEQGEEDWRKDILAVNVCSYLSRQEVVVFGGFDVNVK